MTVTITEDVGVPDFLCVAILFLFSVARPNSRDAMHGGAMA